MFVIKTFENVNDGENLFQILPYLNPERPLNFTLLRLVFDTVALRE
jgi:hypothetical protein